MGTSGTPVQVSQIESRILLIRGEKVILDADLAGFYGVTTKRLNEQVKRNALRFPGDFVFSLTPGEKNEVVAKCDHLSKLKFSRMLPKAFTEHGALMAASVLNTRRAVEVSVFVIRAFVRLREVLSQHVELARRITNLERKLAGHDERILSLVSAIRQLSSSSTVPESRRIGFHVKP